MIRIATRVSFVCAAFACLFLSTPLSAAKQKPDFALKTRAAEATVLIDSALKSDPKLTADLLADGKKWVGEQNADAESARKEDPDRFKTHRYTFERSYKPVSEVAGRYVSIVRMDYSETGGAHPNADLDTIIWDKTAEKRISIRPFFTDLAVDSAALKAMRTAIVAALKVEKKERGADADDESWFQGLEPNLLKIGSVTLAPSTEQGKSSGLTFHFPQYAVGSYAEGPYEAFLPWATLKPYLSADGAALFGGERVGGKKASRRK